jgi:hypothetical protein
MSGITSITTNIPKTDLSIQGTNANFLNVNDKLSHIRAEEAIKYCNENPKDPKCPEPVELGDMNAGKSRKRRNKRSKKSRSNKKRKTFRKKRVCRK